MAQSITFILPAYNETNSIYHLILDLHELSPVNSSIVIIDDSENDETINSCTRAFNKTGWQLDKTKIIRNRVKGGRGRAVRIGLEFALKRFDSDCFIEMDSDGSHTARMALLVGNHVPEVDFCIGSRYLPESKIHGWSIQRRIFSRMINFIIRKLFTKNISDWTNGLRAYSRASVVALHRHPQFTNGFIYLSEQAVILTNGKFKITQVAIEFQNRTHGSSTVTVREVIDSIKGLITILKKKSELRIS